MREKPCQHRDTCVIGVNWCVYVYFYNSKGVIFTIFHYVGNCTVTILHIVVKPRCWSNPCKNGGTCIKIRNKKYTCKCAGGYKGVKCETGKSDLRTFL